MVRIWSCLRDRVAGEQRWILSNEVDRRRVPRDGGKRDREWPYGGDELNQRSDRTIAANRRDDRIAREGLGGKSGEGDLSRYPARL